MESQEYLNQISAKVRPEKSTKGGLGFLNSFYVKIILGTIAAVAVLAIVGNLISGTRVDESSRVITLNARITNVEEIIKTYQKDIKSSDLRSNTASLASVLSNTSRDISEYSNEKYKAKIKDATKKAEATTTKEKEDINTEIFSAKINGILDRIFAHKMAYLVSVFITKEEEIINTTRDSALKEILAISHESLVNLYDKFNDFSEAK